MENLIQIVHQHIDQAHWLLFGMLMLAGLNVPFSEDIIVITAGALAATISPLAPYQFWFIIFLGCWISAWEAYALGRFFGPKLYSIKWFNWVLTKERIERLHVLYDKLGIFTFLIGRFIPGGFRNLLFLSSGMGKMPFPLYLMRDTPACLLSTTTLFSLGYFFGQNFDELINNFKIWSRWVLVVFILLILLALLIYYRKNRKIC